MNLSNAQKNQKDFEKFIKAELNNIDVDKFFEGIHQGKDPGQDYVLWWITEKGKNFREKWNNSVCSQCLKWNQKIIHGQLCCLQMLKNCKEFVIDNS